MTDRCVQWCFADVWPINRRSRHLAHDWPSVVLTAVFFLNLPKIPVMFPCRFLESLSGAVIDWFFHFTGCALLFSVICACVLAVFRWEQIFAEALLVYSDGVLTVLSVHKLLITIKIVCFNTSLGSWWNRYYQRESLFLLLFFVAMAAWCLLLRFLFPACRDEQV